MKRAVSIVEAKARFAEFVREAEAGEPVAITRHGRVVAGVVSADDLAAVRARRQSREKGSLLELRKHTEMNELVKELDAVVEGRGAPRHVPGFE
jgi:prevent-host-death family protein